MLKDLHHHSTKVNTEAAAKAISDGKRSARKALQEERRISARLRAAGELCFQYFSSMVKCYTM